MRFKEVANLEYQLAFWKLVSDKMWDTSACPRSPSVRPNYGFRWFLLWSVQVRWSGPPKGLKNLEGTITLDPQIYAIYLMNKYVLIRCKIV